MARSVRLKSILTEDEMKEGNFSSEIQQYFFQKQDCNEKDDGNKLSLCKLECDGIGRADIIKFLSDNLFKLSQGDFASDNLLKVFESLIVDSTSKSKDKDLLLVLRNNGWNGSEFRLSNTVSLDPNALFLDFLNLHLRSTDKEHPRKNCSFLFKQTRKLSIIVDTSKKTEGSYADVDSQVEETASSGQNFYFEQVN